MSEPFVLSLSKHTPPFDRLKANGNLILHKAESIVSLVLHGQNLGSTSWSKNSRFHAKLKDKLSGLDGLLPPVLPVTNVLLVA
ncbi:hypothetical protein MGMO_160c00030 [Methyloglobulus morosus KoM1]|uniref:Uncharacterized protein n=1 Tax=Methyloglobulus morosus KoM1 TaxID=1116472 RepID=V5BNC8_9GAMM|nr:hypothetical protein MGMO_160c00030 [Methyloglobulus morosus KoM1]